RDWSSDVCSSDLSLGTGGAQFAGQTDRSSRSLGVEGYRIHAELCVFRSPAIGVLNHQVHVDWQLADLVQRIDHGQAQGQIGNEVVVHDVHVDRVRGVDAFQLCGQVCKVCGQDRRVDPRVRHGCSLEYSDLAKLFWSGWP